MLTRSQVRQLEYTQPMPKEIDGKKKVYEEVHIKGGGQINEMDAKIVLQEVKGFYTEKLGWYSTPDREGVFKDVDGRWYAYRHQAKYR